MEKKEITDFHRFLGFMKKEYISYRREIMKRNTEIFGYLSLYEFHKLYNIWKFEQDYKERED